MLTVPHPATQANAMQNEMGSAIETEKMRTTTLTAGISDRIEGAEHLTHPPNDGLGEGTTPASSRGELTHSQVGRLLGAGLKQEQHQLKAVIAQLVREAVSHKREGQSQADKMSLGEDESVGGAGAVSAAKVASEQALAVTKKVAPRLKTNAARCRTAKEAKLTKGGIKDDTVIGGMHCKHCKGSNTEIADAEQECPDNLSKGKLLVMSTTGSPYCEDIDHHSFVDGPTTIVSSCNPREDHCGKDTAKKFCSEFAFKGGSGMITKVSLRHTDA